MAGGIRVGVDEGVSEELKRRCELDRGLPGKHIGYVEKARRGGVT